MYKKTHSGQNIKISDKAMFGPAPEYTGDHPLTDLSPPRQLVLIADLGILCIVPWALGNGPPSDVHILVPGTVGEKWSCVEAQDIPFR